MTITPNGIEQAASTLPAQSIGASCSAFCILHWYYTLKDVNDQDPELINVLAVRRRPPYNYDDLRDLLGSL